jgi:hypothetical protein
LQFGWTWNQEWYDNPTTIDYKDGWFKLGLDLYSQQSAAIAWLFDVSVLYFNNTQITVESFKAMLSTEIYYFYESRRTCIFSYTTVDDFLISSDIEMQFITCYKDFIVSLWTLDNWTSKYAKWIDSCSLSTPETLQPINYDFSASTFSKDLLGNKRAHISANTDYDASDCYPGFFWTSAPFGGAMGQLQDNFVDYVAVRMMQYGKDK